MKFDIYHSGMTMCRSYWTICGVFCLLAFIMILPDLALAQSAGANALINTGKKALDDGTSVIKSYGIPLGTLVIGGIACMVMILGKQWIGKLVWPVIGILILTMCGIIATWAYTSSGATPPEVGG